jgi:hypothetical protein
MISATMTLDNIREVAPSAFAPGPHESRSGRYAYIPPSTVIEGLIANDFLPVLAAQSKSRVKGKTEFTKHMLRFRHASLGATAGDSVPELVMINSHDGTSAYKLMGGIFRFVCANGLVVADSMCASVNVYHKGNIVDDVIEGSFQVMEDTERALAVSAQWQAINLSYPEQRAFAEAAHSLRFADADGKIDTPIEPEQLLIPRRSADTGSDLWRTFNRIQENAIRGGLKARHNQEHDFRRVTSRPVKGIDQDVRLNRSLWALAEKMAALKSA